MSSESTSSEVEALRQRLTEYEQAFAATAPRLAAFKQLEDLARLQKSTPEAIAVKAALDILHEEKDALQHEKDETESRVGELRSEHEALQSEVSLVLIQKKTHDEQNLALKIDCESMASSRDQLRHELGALVIERDSLVQERESLIQNRGDVDGQREALDTAEAELQGRRGELRLLGQDLEKSLIMVRSELSALMQSKQNLQTEVEGLRTEVAHRHEELATRDQELDVAPSKTNSDSDFGLDGDSDGGDDAFGRFFDADIDHDKSRDWILK